MIWTPQEGPQTYVSILPTYIEDIFLGGGRGGGKTSTIGGMFQQYWFEYGRFAKGLVVRKTYDEFEEIIEQFNELFCPFGAKYHQTQHIYRFPDGGTLKLKYIEREQDATREKGKQYGFIAVDEADDFPDPKGLDRLWACLRSILPNQRKVYLKTGNAGGKGHNWLKNRYIKPSPKYVPFQAEEEIKGERKKIWRIYVEAKLDDNKILNENDPGYRERLYRTGPDWLVKAWLDCDWDIVAGGAFDDLWNPARHLIEPFQIPSNWRMTRSLDWGTAKPFSVLWYAHANGESVKGVGPIPKNTIIVVAEWYGAKKDGEGLKMTSKQVAQDIKKKEVKFDRKILPGAADASIYSTQDEDPIAANMKSQGVEWIKADNTQGSRKAGFEAIRTRLENTNSREGPGLLIFNTCRELNSHLPVLQRNMRDIEDVDSDQEDHDYDSLRYEVNRHRTQPIILVAGSQWK